MFMLRDDDYGILPDVYLTNAQGYYIAEFEPGFPEFREDTEQRTAGDGILDFTRSHGAATVTMRMLITNVNRYGRSRRSLLDDIMYHCAPSARSYLHWQLNDEVESRCMMLRAGRVTRGVQAHNRQEVLLSWIAPRGVQESSELQVINVGPDALTGQAGRVYDLTFDRTYPASAPQGTTSLVNRGTAVAYPRLRIHGSCQDPLIRNDTAKLQMRFQNLSIPAGSYLEIDMYRHTILMNGDSTDTRMNFVRWGDSDWFGVLPGPNEWVFQAASFSGAKVEVIYRHAWL